MYHKEKLFVSNKDMPESVKKERVIGVERIANVHIPMYIYSPISIALTYYSLAVLHINLLYFSLFFISAFVFWSCFEYFAHRYVLHYEASSDFGKKLMYGIHHGHHDYPNDKRFILVGLEITIPALFIFYGVFYLLLGATYVNAYMAGMVTCYVMYDWLHYATHEYNFKNELFQRYKRHHMNHHYLDDGKNFGFISFIWDELMNTRIGEQYSKRKRVGKT